ncbi:carboxylate--amine ligase [Pseudactinotalea sp. HY158]|uniref:carboxylate--amine ligase n=1 Tax=Pseudactinotalea sp. HY158 TaxID=2654547 RepID=UPI00129C396B|nr:carboxylate--amine ligase [Pseudactinotalea sp. HY158]QGH69310.1 carboxylate--amine ligase [Pseudactinotalea sp. HY158]
MTTIRPIILGGDLGAYATARAFHEARGVRSVVLTGVRTGPVADSAIVDLRILDGLEHPDAAVRAVLDVAAEAPGTRPIVLGSADWYVELLGARRDELAAAGVIVPYPGPELLARATDKAAFSRLCDELGIPHPRTVVLRADEPIPSDVPAPCVVKAASSAAFHALELDGKNKVEFLADRNELGAYFGRVAAAGYGGEFVVQEHVPGADSDMAAVNACYGPDGRGHLLLFGQVLLEEHTPNGRGNSVAQITGGGAAHAPTLEHARRLLSALGWTGFANLDLKRGPDGTYYFLELNPRVGRSGYAVTAAGYNVADWYVRAFADGEPAPAEPVEGTAEHLFTVVPLALLRRYLPEHLRARVRRLRRAGAVTNPYYYRAEHGARRWLYVAGAMVNQFRKFAAYHPTGTTGTSERG